MNQVEQEIRTKSNKSSVIPPKIDSPKSSKQNKDNKENDINKAINQKDKKEQNEPSSNILDPNLNVVSNWI